MSADDQTSFWPVEPTETVATVTLATLTLWPEWLLTFTELDKRTENRSWPCPRRLMGQDLVLHAGASIGGGSWKRARTMLDVAELAGWSLDYTREPAGVRVDGLRTPQSGLTWFPIPLGSAAAVVRIVGCDKDERTDWDMPNAWHWRVDRVRRIQPLIPMKGRQGLFWATYPASILDAPILVNG